MEKEQIIPSIIKRLKIKKKHLHRAFDEVGEVKEWRSKKICNGNALPDGWEREIFKEVLLKAMDFQADAMLGEIMPKRYRNTKEARAKYKAQNKRKVEQFLNGKQLVEKIAPHIEFLFFDKIELKRLDFPGQAKISDETPKMKDEFFKIPVEYAYTVSRNLEAFYIFLTPAVAEFYKHISHMSETEKKDFKDWLFLESNNFTVEEAVSLLNAPAIQQWLKISNSQYKKTFSMRQSKERKKQRSKKIIKWADEADQVLMAEAWNLFYDDTKFLLCFDNFDLIAMIRNAKILEHNLDMELLIGFLCCLPLQEKVLNKLRTC